MSKQPLSVAKDRLRSRDFMQTFTFWKLLVKTWRWDKGETKGMKKLFLEIARYVDNSWLSKLVQTQDYPSVRLKSAHFKYCVKPKGVIPNSQEGCWEFFQSVLYKTKQWSCLDNPRTTSTTSLLNKGWNITTHLYLFHQRSIMPCSCNMHEGARWYVHPAL